MFNLGIQVGGAIGPIVGGGLTEKYNFSVSCVATGFLNLFYLFLYTYFYYDEMKERIDMIRKGKFEVENYTNMENLVDRSDNDKNEGITRDSFREMKNKKKNFLYNN